MQGREFDWMKIPLSGKQLIEASAGTGKTWTLTMIYLRVLLETPLALENILVVTFTQAATNELKDRLRKTLAQTWHLLNHPPPDEDKTAAALYARYRDNPYLLRKLYSALRHFDQAAIYTIHGFCQRILSDHAFQMGSPFKWELNQHTRELLSEAIELFWQKEIANSKGCWPRFLYQEGIEPKKWLTEIHALLGKGHYSHIILPSVPDIVALENTYYQAYELAQSLWRTESSVIENLISANKLGYRKSYFAALYRLFSGTNPILLEKGKEGKGGLNRFSSKVLEDLALAKNKTPFSHPFFMAVDKLLIAYEELWAAFVAKKAVTTAQLLTYCETYLAQAKLVRQEMSYDDLLYQVDKALQADKKGRLALLMQQRFGAALIDEFQDTDPIQYRIFMRIYSDEKYPVFFIGDPKQAIYSFRGADIYTYLVAMKETKYQWTLGVNYRSTPAMIKSVNALFTYAPNPFYLPQITYSPVREREEEFLSINDPNDKHDTHALHCWQPVGKNDQICLSKRAALEAILHALGSEIHRLLCQVKIGENLLTPTDIAILVPSHYYADQVLGYLNKVGIQATCVGMESIFVSQEAQECLRIMKAFLEPQRESLRKSALTTICMGVDAPTLCALSQDENAWESIALQFIHYHDVWEQYGITRAFYTWFYEWKVGERLVRLEEGERRLSNLLHLIEILQQKSQTLTQLNLLCDWFIEALNAPDEQDETTQLRLESDTAQIKIMTIHAAKGLEFPVVFCPFLWHTPSQRMQPYTAIFHDAQGENQLDFGSVDYQTHEKYAQEENFAEKLRVLYVALTRARYRTYVSWGKIKGIEKSPLAWLLYQTELKQNNEALSTLSDSEFWKPWQCLPHTNLLALPLAPIPDRAISADTKANLACAVWQRKLPLPTKSITSFSALTQRHYFPTSSQLPWEKDNQESLPLEGIAAFPAGARTGLCWHAILERWDFISTTELTHLIFGYLEAYGFSSTWYETVRAMLETLSEVRIDGQALKEVSGTARLSEMEFTCRLSAFTYQNVAQVLAEKGEISWAKACTHLSFEAAEGLMTGFIDLIVEIKGKYFILDYKSNWLGKDVAAYQASMLKEAMATHHYYLQYLIYTVALHRYLRRCIADYHYDTHFGGVVYIFMRGLVADTESGIFRDRPSLALIEALDQLFDGN